MERMEYNWIEEEKKIIFKNESEPRAESTKRVKFVSAARWNT